MIHIAPLRLSERARWAELWSEYQIFYGVELPAAVSDNTWQRLHNGRVQGLGARNSAVGAKPGLYSICLRGASGS
jgi:hypothetical protein